MEMKEHLIDASDVYNNTKYINASVTHNAEFRNNIIDGAMRCAIYLKRVISPGEEITCNYKY